MIKIIYTFILSITFSVLVASNVFAGPKGPATQYEMTMTKVEICEVGSTDSNCLNPVTVSPSGETKTADIASVNSGSSVGSFGSLSSLSAGKTYSYIQVTMSRLFTISGTTSAGCATNSGGTAGSLTLYGVGQTATTGTAQTLSVPNTVGMNATLPDTINGAADANGDTVSAVSVIANADTHMQFRQELSESFSMKAGNVPSLTLAFDMSNAVESNGTCTNAVMNVAEPTVTITVN